MRLANHPATVDITSEDIARGEIVVRGAWAQVIANVRGAIACARTWRRRPSRADQAEGPGPLIAPSENMSCYLVMCVKKTNRSNTLPERMQLWA